MKTLIQIVNPLTGAVIFERSTIGNTIKATLINALVKGVVLPKDAILVY